MLTVRNSFSSKWTLVVIWKTRMKMTTYLGKCLHQLRKTCCLHMKGTSHVPFDRQIVWSGSGFSTIVGKTQGWRLICCIEHYAYLPILKVLVKVKFVGLGTKTTFVLRFEPFSSDRMLLKRFILIKNKIGWISAYFTNTLMY